VQVLPARLPGRPINYSKEVSAQKSTDLLNSLFKEEGILHHQLISTSKSCCKLSAKEQTAHKKLKDKFKHEWLVDKDISFCSDTGIWWLAYLEGRGMFCLLCRKHNPSSKFNKSKIFNLDGSVRFQKPTLIDHSNSQQHRDAISAEHLQRLSTFHREITEKENTAHDVFIQGILFFVLACKRRNSQPKVYFLVVPTRAFGTRRDEILESPITWCCEGDVFGCRASGF